ncbi:torsin-1A-interacting protein 1 isoform X3 [Silurus meridionalis]|uniref:Torsin-1A-interacting protein 1/2 AAA+ activator domain-containing protein n=1 Tax=Silurus meridionalis TaxID=175797 RepID=A0A8T0ATD8_SILME|nr:torsin-1A-interacting protein 1 isoform X3 [Silurus meridionalis]KAF7695402.1 hypothetical protein HF521_007125 [Silurus meridionalis]
MDCVKLESAELRRSTRLSRNKVFAIELKPREALKRKRDIKHVPTMEECNTDEGSPDKIPKLQVTKDAEDRPENGDQINTVEMDVEEEEEEDADQNQNMSSEDESENCGEGMKTKPVFNEDVVIKTLHVGSQNTEEIRAYLRKQTNKHQKSQVPELPKMSGCGDTVHEPTRTDFASTNIKQVKNRTDILTLKSSIKEYQNKMKEKARGYSGPNLQDMDRYPYVEDQKTHITHKTNNLSAEKQSLNYTNTESRKRVLKKAGLTSPSKATACSVFRWLQWAVFLLASLVLGLMGYQHFPSSIKTTELQTRSLYGASFGTHLGHLRQLFPSQRPELWKRTEVHVRRHLNLTDPTEPVSLMLTSGRRAEKTLRCLAQQLAAAFSNTLNSSVLEIDGTSKSSQDSDQVKLDIDKLLEEAFAGGTQAAVIQRFEELPPGSTLIFYRYCDHENSAFKKVFLVFTVMLPVEELDFKLSLGAVEEQVQEALKEKFVSSDRTAKFNQMDVDKLSGLWSRISHLILPVAAEQKIEQHGCGEDGSL